MINGANSRSRPQTEYGRSWNQVSDFGPEDVFGSGSLPLRVVVYGESHSLISAFLMIFKASSAASLLAAFFDGQKLEEATSSPPMKTKH